MKERFSIIWFVFLFFIAKASPVISQPVIFNKILPPDGTSFGIVTGIKQDINGYMWFATTGGLYRYDGYHFTLYVHDPLNPRSLAADWIESLYTDQEGIIWIGTFGRGLDQFDPETGIFTHFPHDANDPASLGNNIVTAILLDTQGILWIGTHGGLDQLDPNTKKFIHYRFNANDPASISNNQVRAIYEDRQGTLWIGTGSPYPDDGLGPEEGGLNRMDQKTGTFTRYMHDPGNKYSLVNNKVSAIFEDNQGVLWVGTGGNGLHRMDRLQGSFERIIFDPKHPEKIYGPPLTKESPVYEHITFITQDAAGSYWIGTVAGGINYFNPAIGKILHYKGTENSSAGFIEKGAWCTYTSRDGILWIGTPYETWNSTPGGNIYLVDPNRKEIPRYVTSSYVNCFYKEPNGILWIGTEKGLVRKNLNNQHEKFWLHDSTNENSLADNRVMALRADSDGKLWMAVHLGGVDRFDQKTEKFTHFKHDEKNPESLINDYTHCLLFDTQKMLWIGTHSGLSRMDIKTGLCVNYKHDSKDSLTLCDGQIYSIVQEKNGAIWVAADAGISRFESKSGKFHRYLNGNFINTVCIDVNGIIWAGGKGVFYFDSKKDYFIEYKSPRFPKGIEHVLGIVEDDKKNLWIYTENTLIRVNEKRDELKIYNASHGILISSSVWREGYKTNDGHLYLGADSGYYSFNPDELNETRTGPLLHLNTFSIGNKVIYTGQGNELSPPLWKMENISLSYNQNTFSFDFSAVDYKTSGTIKYMYMLENYYNDWFDIGNEQKTTFFNVPQGKYIFRVRAMNGEGSVAEKNIVVIIKPPWWLTWWAYCIYGSVFVVVILAIYNSQKKRIIRREREKSQMKELFHAKEIEKAYHELRATQAQLIQSEKMASLGELTAGIAHEIQNPLNFVNNFSEVNKELLLEMKVEIDKGYSDEVKAITNIIIENEEKINHHGKRADAIVKGMLQHSRTSMGIKEPTDINALADEYLRLAYHGLRAKDKTFNATMKTDFDESLGNITIIPQDIGRVILNLITNAFYAVTEKKRQIGGGFEPSVTVITKRVGSPSDMGDSVGKIEIRVKDNGNGIPQKVLDKIFQPFFTTKPAGQGTGLGLSLSYDIIKAHGGELKVETREGEFAEFIIILTV